VIAIEGGLINTMTIDDVVEAWNRFFHTPTPADSLGLFRIVWGLLLVLSGTFMLRKCQWYFGPTGLFSMDLYHMVYGRSRFTLFNLMPPTKRSVYWILGAFIISSGALAVGFYTRWSALIAFLTMVSLHHRNPGIVHGGDTAMRLFTFLLIFSHAGQAYSVDQYLQKTEAAVVDPWCQRLMQIQVCIIYLRSVWWKLQGTRWLGGTAAYFPIKLISFQRMQVPAMFLNRPMVMIATYGTVVAEFGLGTLVWFEELRYPMLIVGVALHLSIGVFLHLELFGLTMISTYVLFLRSNDTRRFVEYISSFFL
jgi:hypothetical protein